jgi:hypothetical protein
VVSQYLFYFVFAQRAGLRAWGNFSSWMDAGKKKLLADKIRVLGWRHVPSPCAMIETIQILSFFYS